MPNINLLAVETSTEACSAAILTQGKILEKYQLAERCHNKLILAMINELLIDAGSNKSTLDAIAFGRGPGSFTGVRIACGVAQGISFALDIPVLAISSLAILAQQHVTKYNQICVAIDARMSEVYWGLYKANTAGLVYLHGEEMVSPPNKVSPPKQGEWFGIGSGWDRYQPQLSQILGKYYAGYESNHFPRASAMLPLAKAAYENGELLPSEKATPVYIRNKIV